MRGCCVRGIPDLEVVTVNKLVWFLLGAASGFVLAHFVNKDPRGHDLLAQVDARIAEFTDRVSDAYHQQEARLADDDAPAAQAVHDAAIDAADAAEAVGDAARTTTD
jgi:hypothetical protein